jgi:hypothetical protein
MSQIELPNQVQGVLPVANGGTGSASIPTWNQNTTGSSASCTGNAATATKLATARTINNVSFDGSANIVIVPRIGTLASSATPTITVTTTDQFNITALAAAITGFTISGTPVDGQKLMVRIKDNGTARAIAWGTSFASSGVATLLATTVANKTHLVGFIYDAVTTKFVCVAVDATGY